MSSGNTTPLRALRQAIELVLDALCFPFVIAAAAIILSLTLFAARTGRRRFRLSQVPTILCLQPGLLQAYRLQGDEILSYFRGPGDVHILDAVSDSEVEIEGRGGVRIIGWNSSRLARMLFALGLRECSLVVREIVAVRRLLRYVEANGIHCLRSMQHEYSALRGAIVGGALQIPHVIEIAGNYEMLRRIWGRTIYFPWLGRVPLLKWPLRMLNNALLGWPLKRAFCVIGRNKNNYEHAFALGASVERLTLIRINLAETFFTAQNDVPVRDRRYMIFVARMTTEKFPLDVLEVYEHLAAVFPDLELVMIGDGDLLPEVRRRAQRMASAGRIRILGAKSYDEVIRFTKGASLAFETYSGSALAEKMICEVPVVAYDVEWMSEIVIDGFSGQLARFRDTKSAFEACRRVLDDPEYAGRIARTGRSLALAMFDLATIAQKEARVFEEALFLARLRHGNAKLCRRRP